MHLHKKYVRELILGSTEDPSTLYAAVAATVVHLSSEEEISMILEVLTMTKRFPGLRPGNGAPSAQP